MLIGIEYRDSTLAAVAPVSTNCPLRQGAFVLGVAWDVADPFIGVGAIPARLGTQSEPAKFGTIPDVSVLCHGHTQKMNLAPFTQPFNDNVKLTLDAACSGGRMAVRVFSQEIRQ